MNGNDDRIHTPCYVVQEEKLVENLNVLSYVQKKSGAHVLLAQKAFSMFAEYRLIARYLSGTTASGLYEARLGREEMPDREVHVYCPAYREEEMEEILFTCDHVIFNTPNQWNKYKKLAQTVREKKEQKGETLSCGIRVNPGYSEIETDLYNPCITGSRLGTPTGQFLEAWESGKLDGIEGIHFHTMCEQGADVLARTLEVIKRDYTPVLKKMKWLNMGGGHHITRKDYDVECLIRLIDQVRKECSGASPLTIYLEPGEAVALDAGILITSVLDILENGKKLAILDTSAACHMPDVLEMPYRPEVIGAGMPGEKPYEYTFGGPTCLAGDVIGTYSFDRELQVGDRLVFCDMAIYSMVKNNTFNGMPLPDIAVERNGIIQCIKQFGYDDFKGRLS